MPLRVILRRYRKVLYLWQNAVSEGGFIWKGRLFPQGAYSVKNEVRENMSLFSYIYVSDIIDDNQQVQWRGRDLSSIVALLKSFEGGCRIRYVPGGYIDSPTVCSLSTIYFTSESSYLSYRWFDH